MKKLYSLFIFLFTLPTFAMDLITVDYVDVQSYVGRWYQIAHNPMPFEPKNCVCAQQTLKILETGELGVYNSCNEGSAKGKLNDIKGTAINDDPQTNAKFTVDFGLPFKGSYWVIGLDEDYRWAVVTDRIGKSLYILSKTPELSEDLFQAALAKAAEQLSLEKLLITEQTDCTYPAPPF